MAEMKFWWCKRAREREGGEVGGEKWEEGREAGGGEMGGEGAGCNIGGAEWEIWRDR